MKSLIFCTAYVRNSDEWRKRYQKWIDYYTSLSFSEGKSIFLIDDGSDEDNLKDFKGNRYNEGDDYLCDTLSPQVNLYHFTERLGINGEDNLPHLGGSTVGWFRSFFFSYFLAQRNNYDRIIHIESDAYLISKRMCDYIDSLESGWTTLYCPTYNFPESSIQVICRDTYDTMGVLANMPLDNFRQANAEYNPYVTHVEKGYIGDRYGERTTDQPPNIDYYNQCNLDTNLKFTN